MEYKNFLHFSIHSVPPLADLLPAYTEWKVSVGGGQKDFSGFVISIQIIFLIVEIYVFYLLNLTFMTKGNNLSTMMVCFFFYNT